MTQKNDVRAALLMDTLHGRLYVYTPGKRPRFEFLPAGLPPDLHRIDDPDVAYRLKADDQENKRDLFREAAARLAGCTQVVLLGPGTAKDEFANEIGEVPRYRGVPFRRVDAPWMDEPTFERWARAELSVPEDAPLVFVRAQQKGARRRRGGPGAPIDPSTHQRTNEIRRPAAAHGEPPQSE